MFVDFKKALDRVWHAALWATTLSESYNTCNKATSTVLYNGVIGDWFRTTTGERQGCLLSPILSPILFNIFLERIMTDALADHEGTVGIGGRPITDLRFAD